MTTNTTEFRLADLPDRIRSDVYTHVFESPDAEVGGVLVGVIDGRTGRPRVTGTIAALEAVGARASVTFTHEAWETIIELQERDFPNTQIVGWYHSHPGFGIFLSEHDLFIHRNFFADAHQFAYVIDPIEETEGVFGWRDGAILPFEQGVVTTVDEHGRVTEQAQRAASRLVIELDDEGDAEESAVLAVDVDDHAPDEPVAAGPRRIVRLDEDNAPVKGRPWARLAVAMALVAAVVIGGVVLLGPGGGQGSVVATPVGKDTTAAEKFAKALRERVQEQQHENDKATADAQNAIFTASNATAPPPAPKTHSNASIVGPATHGEVAGVVPSGSVSPSASSGATSPSTSSHGAPGQDLFDAGAAIDGH